MLALLYFGILGTTEETTRVTVFEAAMGPQIGGAIVAVQHGLNPPLVSLMVGLGILPVPVGNLIRLASEAESRNVSIL